ncbi:hypothetical protein Tco_1440060 [Tanacetum coccineum]
MNLRQVIVMMKIFLMGVRESPDAPLVEELVSDDKLTAITIKGKAAHDIGGGKNVLSLRPSRILLEDMLPLGEEPKEGKLLVKELLKLVSLILRFCTLSRRHLQLADADGISSLPTTKIFEQLSLMGVQFLYRENNQIGICGSSAQISYSDLVADETVHKERGDSVERAATTATSLDAELGQWTMKQTKQIYGAAYTRLIKKVKKLEKIVKSSQARRRARIVVFDDERYLEITSNRGGRELN